MTNLPPSNQVHPKISRYAISNIEAGLIGELAPRIMHQSRAQIVTANVQAFLMRLQVLLYCEQIPPEQYEGLTNELRASVVGVFSDLIIHVIDEKIPLLDHWSRNEPPEEGFISPLLILD